MRRAFVAKEDFFRAPVEKGVDHLRFAGARAPDHGAVGQRGGVSLSFGSKRTERSTRQKRPFERPEIPWSHHPIGSPQNRTLPGVAEGAQPHRRHVFERLRKPKTQAFVPQRLLTAKLEALDRQKLVVTAQGQKIFDRVDPG